MLRIPGITGKKLTKLTLNAGAGILLLLYVTGFLLPHGLVPHSEHDHLVESGHADENDPCHLAIYHPGNENSCDHKYHFTKNPEKCKWCDIIILRQILVSETTLQSAVASFIRIPICNVEDPFLEFQFSHADRGPPAFSI